MLHPLGHVPVPGSEPSPQKMAAKRLTDVGADTTNAYGNDHNMTEDDGNISDPLSTQSSETMLQPSILFNELHFLALESQSNIYGMARLQYNEDTTLLVATIRDGIFQVHYDPVSLRLSWKRIEFSYIPGN